MLSDKDGEVRLDLASKKKRAGHGPKIATYYKDRVRLMLTN